MPPPTIKTRTEGTVVPPRSKKVIAANAQVMRQFLKLEKQDYFPVPAVYATLGMMFDGADFEVFEDDEMGEDHGRTYPDQLQIVLRNSVYERACGGGEGPFYDVS